MMTIQYVTLGLAIGMLIIAISVMWLDKDG